MTEKCDLKLLSASDIRKEITEGYEGLKVPPAVKYWLRVFDSSRRIRELVSCKDVAVV